MTMSNSQDHVSVSRILTMASGIPGVICWKSAAARGALRYDTATPEPTSAFDNYVALISNLVLPNVPGALLLLALSICFSTINFYTEVPVNKRSIKGSGRYLVLWICINYLFALFILLLMLPETVVLSSISKTLFVYCFLATAIPELAANLKLQFAGSQQTIDLYKYKSQVSGIISHRVASSVAQSRSLQLIALSHHYYGRLDEFLDRLSILMNQEGVTDTEREKLNRLSDSLRAEPIRGEARRTMQLEGQYADIADKLLQFFEQDILAFSKSPAAHLMKHLQPHLGIEEALRLVDAGVTSAPLFMLCCRWRRFRKYISVKADIHPIRVDAIYNYTRFVRRQRSFVRVRQLSVVVVIAVTAIALFVRHENRELERKQVSSASIAGVTQGSLRGPAETGSAGPRVEPQASVSPITSIKPNASAPMVVPQPDASATPSAEPDVRVVDGEPQAGVSAKSNPKSIEPAQP